MKSFNPTYLQINLKKCDNLHATGSTAPDVGVEDTPVSSSAEKGFISFCCWLGDTMAADFCDDKTFVYKDKLYSEKDAFLNSNKQKNMIFVFSLLHHHDEEIAKKLL